MCYLICCLHWGSVVLVDGCYLFYCFSLLFCRFLGGLGVDVCLRCGELCVYVIYYVVCIRVGC